MIISDEIKRNVEEAAVIVFKVLSRHSPGGTEENHEILR
jgi:hypothetical protein